jgi:hypothetical protein
MHRSHVPIQEWFWAAYLVTTLTPRISALQLQRQLDLGSYRTAWFMLNRLRKGTVSDSRSRLSGIVEADLGACRRNSHLEFFVAKSGNQKPMSDLFLSNMVTKSVKRKQKWEAAISKGNSSTGS